MTYIYIYIHIHSPQFSSEPSTPIWLSDRLQAKVGRAVLNARTWPRAESKRTSESFNEHFGKTKSLGNFEKMERKPWEAESIPMDPSTFSGGVWIHRV